MIKKEDVLQIGYISKYRGISGEVEITFTDNVFDEGDSEYLVFLLDGLFVPFFWEEYRFKNNDTAIFKFEEINSEAEAKKFVKTPVYYPTQFIPETDILRSWKSLVGFAIHDLHKGCIGEVSAVDDSSANILLYISTNTHGEEKEIIIPFHDDFLVEYDIKQHSILLDLPEGLLNLN
ncbi:MAG: 16S rRNA processing protein RimM [Bacteroidaceae bacterium]|nr:16S rRNA processing protein RimM [Bacteroidaceae bacterium]MBR2862927.1 16S rRNA processing protein RimM [Bacteroidaceae bacterium]